MNDENSRKSLLLAIANYLNEDKEHKSTKFIPGKSEIPVSGALIFPEDIVDVVDCVLDGWFTEWKIAGRFSKELGRCLGIGNVTLCNSGSSANLLALTTALNHRTKKHQYKVITCATGFPTTVAPIVQHGFVPLFVDVNPDTLNANIDIVSDLLYKPDVSGVILAHTLGFPYDAKSLMLSAYNADKFFIEDICDALGAEIGGELVGGFGDMSTLSLFPAHHITTGEGGVVFTPDDELKVLLDSYNNWGRDCYCLPGQTNTCGKRFEHEWPNLPKGWDHKYTFSHFGYNLKMTEIQAALGLAQLKHLSFFVQRRKENYGYLHDALIELINRELISTVNYPKIYSPSPFGFPITVKNENCHELVRFLENRKIRTRPIFGGNLVRQPMFSNPNDYQVVNSLDGSDYVMEHTFWIGCHPSLSFRQLDYVIDSIYEYFK